MVVGDVMQWLCKELPRSFSGQRGRRFADVLIERERVGAAARRAALGGAEAAGGAAASGGGRPAWRGGGSGRPTSL
ncbi:hypothetical protein [Oryza sativa Japonica Group]|uniref:Uncharacterized protein n=1 Tax=Oryza sativa subsp. japonica TaxID=39947 RepID=Q5JLS5_ORYSJ|nr:hypothetical protein [Oryza sativa Japonica Group]